MAEPQVTASTDFVATHSSKLSELMGFGNQIESAFAAVEVFAAEADVRLRSEIGQVTMFIDQAVGTSKQQVDALEAATTQLAQRPFRRQQRERPCPRSALARARPRRAQGAAGGRARAQDR